MLATFLGTNGRKARHCNECVFRIGKVWVELYLWYDRDIYSHSGSFYTFPHPNQFRFLRAGHMGIHEGIDGEGETLWTTSFSLYPDVSLVWILPWWGILRWCVSRRCLTARHPDSITSFHRQKYGWENKQNLLEYASNLYWKSVENIVCLSLQNVLYSK